MSIYSPQFPTFKRPKTGSLPAHPPTIHHQSMSAHIATRLTRQVHRGSLKIFGRSPSARGDSSTDACQSLRVVQQRSVHLCLNVSRRNGIDCDALGCPLVGKRLCDLANGALGRGVGGDCEAALESEQRGEVDDATATAGDGGDGEGEHLAAKVAAESEDGVEVDLDDL